MTEPLRIAVRQFGPFESAIEKQWSSFATAQGLAEGIEAVALDLHTLYQELFDEGGLLDGSWDIAFVPTDWIGEAEAANALVDLSPYLNERPPEDYPTGWSDSLLRFQKFGAKIIGLPYHDGPECLIYRTDLFEELDLRVPVTWQEFHETARQISDRKPGVAGIILAGYPDGHNTVYDFCLQLWTRGGELFDESGHLALETAQAEAALTFYRQIYQDRKVMHSRTPELDSVAAGWAFAKGEGGMTTNWFGFAALCETASESVVKGKVNVAPLPVEPRGVPSASLNVYWMLGVASGSKNKSIAYEFLRHCASVQNDRLLTLEGAIGCRKSTWDDDQVNSVIPFFKELERLHQFARELPRLPQFSKAAALLDRLVCSVRDSQNSIPEVLSSFQHQAARLDL